MISQIATTCNSNLFLQLQLEEISNKSVLAEFVNNIYVGNISLALVHLVLAWICHLLKIQKKLMDINPPDVKIVMNTLIQVFYQFT